MNDREINACLEKESQRQQHHIELIASENFVSLDVLKAQGSCLTNKYAEGYPGKRYYGGCDVMDEVEFLAIERAKKLFHCNFANVQPHSGSQANQAVYLALLTPGDTLLGMGLSAGGHLSHGSSVNLSGKWFSSISYGVDHESYSLDYEDIRRKALQHRPKLIIAGASAYPRVIDFSIFRAIADEIGAYLMVDMAHIAGLVSSGHHPHPFPHAHVVTSTTHKTLRGPRGGLILCNDEDLAKRIDKAVFPGLQGGPLMHVIAAKAVCFHEALSPSFHAYSQKILSNSHALAEELISEGFSLLTGGTDNHLCIVDLRSEGSLSGHKAQCLLEDIFITCNKEHLPNDPLPPSHTSGLRFGTAAMTTRGLNEEEMRLIARWIVHRLRHPFEDIQGLRDKVLTLTNQYPLPQLSQTDFSFFPNL